MTTTLVDNAEFAYVLRLGDDALVLGHRLSEWCGHGPLLEEDIALANIALDCIGQANALLTLAAELEGAARSADDIAFHRDERAYTNARITELPRGDFGFTMMRQFLYSAYAYVLFENLSSSTNETLAGIAAKALKEVRYHLRHCGEGVIRLGDGTEESNQRVQASLDELWRFTGELFEADDVTEAVAETGFGVNMATHQARWTEMVTQVLTTATLTIPEGVYMSSGGRSGLHTEHLGPMLAEMQVLPRSYPNAQW